MQPAGDGIAPVHEQAVRRERSGHEEPGPGHETERMQRPLGFRMRKEAQFAGGGVEGEGRWIPGFRPLRPVSA